MTTRKTTTNTDSERRTEEAQGESGSPDRAATEPPAQDRAGSGTHRRGEHSEELENYAGGYIQARHGKINVWLIVVIVVLLVWGIYYGFTYWGDLGEGLDY